MNSLDVAEFYAKTNFINISVGFFIILACEWR